jgi:hypothetical protein
MGLEGQDAPLAGGARVQNDELEEFFDDDRPQFHIQPPAGWMNDPNGPIYYKGRYHMYVAKCMRIAFAVVGGRKTRARFNKC